ncbi:MAG TPA: CPBP family intramembrane metalloprotease [Chloroflexi bacterium]|nr:CPBP family intramembrane metalloprotease [Chloroflexota bacterium]
MLETKNTVDTRRVLIYCIIAFLPAYLIALVIYLTGGLIDSPSLAAGLNLALLLLIVYMLTPALAHILTRIITREGWNNLYLRPKLKRGWLFWLLAWFGTPALMGIGMLVYFLLFPQNFDPELAVLREMLVSSGFDLDTLQIPLAMLLLIQTLQGVILAPILNAIPILGEEFGWRAYLQPKLMPLGPRKALVVTGIIWGLWHAPIIAMGYNYGNFDPNYWGAPWSGIAMMTLGTIWLGIFFGWLTLKADSVWPAVVGHAVLNGTAAISLYMTRGTPLLLLGPTPVGLVGGIGFIAFALLIFSLPGAFRVKDVVSASEEVIDLATEVD